MFGTSIFTKIVNIPDDVDVIFVSDMFVEDYVGGAELTSQALIDSSPFRIHKLHSELVTPQLIRDYRDKFWIFGNFANLLRNPFILHDISTTLKYTVLEYDYKYCKYRSPEKCEAMTKTPCRCHNESIGRLVHQFYQYSIGMWWMSRAQFNKYIQVFPSLASHKNTVLSSVFDVKTLTLIDKLQEQHKDRERSGWIVLGSNSWVKGYDEAVQWCKAHDKSYEVVWNLPYEQLLNKLAASEGFVYLPAGADTCPRMVIEAKLLGCKLILNNNVQHAVEPWFDGTPNELTQYLKKAPGIFWNDVDTMRVLKHHTISGYTTTYNCASQGYPFEKCIMSMLAFCDEVCVVDGGSSDNTWNALQRMASRWKQLKIKQVPRDWSAPNHAIFDGMQKAEARQMCTSDFCWQMDSDELVDDHDHHGIHELCKRLPDNVEIISLPVIEYWGGYDKVRVDVQPWKWRLSRNKPNITHGIPFELRRTLPDGSMCAMEGTDGCDMIDANTGMRLPHVSFYQINHEKLRRQALGENVTCSQQSEALVEYQRWFNDVVAAVPSVFHFSWFDLPRKIRLYRDYWSRHWRDLIGKDTGDTAENNMFFDVPWSQVTDEMIEARAIELKQIGGHIWHTKWRGEFTPWITCERRFGKDV